MSAATKKCPLCAESIPAEATICQFCGAQFSVTMDGYCTNCHEMRQADATGHCKVCGKEVADLRVESKFIEEAAPQPAPSPLAQAVPAPPPKMQPGPTTTRKSRTWLWVMLGVLGILVIAGFIGGAIWFLNNFEMFFPPQPTATTPPTATRRPPTPTATRRPIPTATSRPLPTATAQPAWIQEFAQPILNDIYNHQPNFEDDFSEMSGRFVRWSSITYGVSFTDGVMRMNTTGMDWVGAGGSLSATDFVLKFEFTPHLISDGSGVCANFRSSDDGWYNFGFNLYDSWWGMGILPTGQENGVLGSGWSEEVGQDHTTIVTIIAKGDEFAFYANGHPLMYTKDSTFQGWTVNLGVWAPADPAEVDFDNVKFWDLNNLLP